MMLLLLASQILSGCGTLKLMIGMIQVNLFESVQGPIGPDGLSAYQLAVAQGYSGTLESWLDSLKGATGSGWSCRCYRRDRPLLVLLVLKGATGLLERLVL